jgi:hypothetical protein
VDNEDRKTEDFMSNDWAALRASVSPW